MVVVRSAWRECGAFSFTENVKVVVIIGWYLGSQLSELGGERVVHIGGAWQRDGSASGACFGFDDAGYNYRLGVRFGETSEEGERGCSNERYRYPCHGGT